jgi:adenylate cyclase
MIRIRPPPAPAILTLIFMLTGAAWGGFLGVRHVAALESVLDRVENLSLDWRLSLAGIRKPPRGVVIAAIDDATIAQAGSFPLSRSVLARIVRGLAAHDPQVIAIDILLLDPGSPEADLDLVEALRSTKTVIAAAGVFNADGAAPDDDPYDDPSLRPGRDDMVPRPTDVLWPQEKFRSVARLGLTNISTDHSGVPRYVPAVFHAGGTIVPSFAVATAALALNTDPVLGNEVITLGGRSTATDVGYHLPLRFYGPRRTIPTFSAVRALNGELDSDDVRGQIVLIGSTAVGGSDAFATPFDRATPGVEVLATAIGNLLAGEALVRNGFTRRIDASVAVVLPVAAILLLAVRRTWLALALTLLAFALWTALTWVAFLQGYWLSVALPAAASFPAVIGYGIGRFALMQRQAQRLASERDALRPFQSPGLGALLLRDPKFLAVPVEQDAAIVFVDLSGFTGVTESLGPAWTRELLVGLHQHIEAAASEQQGFVMSYMGDGAMILFGLPAWRSGDAERALRAVGRLYESLSHWIATLPPVARERLAPRVGGHFGPVVLSRLGTPDHQHITATGDTVNVASRLLEVAKDRHAATAVSDDLCRAARDEGDAAAGDAGDAALDVAIRGRARPLLVRLRIGGA